MSLRINDIAPDFTTNTTEGEISFHNWIYFVIVKSNFLLFFKQNFFLQILLIIFCTIPILSGISSIPPLDRDESRFAQSSYQMIESNDYTNIKFQDEIRAKKPIGIYWLQAFSAKAFGINDISSYRLPSSFGAFPYNSNHT